MDPRVSLVIGCLCHRKWSNMMRGEFAPEAQRGRDAEPVTQSTGRQSQRGDPGPPNFRPHRSGRAEASVARLQEKKALSSRGRGRLRGFLELRRPWGCSPEARRPSRGTHRGAPLPGGCHPPPGNLAVLTAALDRPPAAPCPLGAPRHPRPACGESASVCAPPSPPRVNINRSACVPELLSKFHWGSLCCWSLVGRGQGCYNISAEWG